MCSARRPRVRPSERSRLAAPAATLLTPATDSIFACGHLQGVCGTPRERARLAPLRAVGGDVGVELGPCDFGATSSPRAGAKRARDDRERTKKGRRHRAQARCPRSAPGADDRNTPCVFVKDGGPSTRARVISNRAPAAAHEGEARRGGRRTTRAGPAKSGRRTLEATGPEAPSAAGGEGGGTPHARA